MVLYRSMNRCHEHLPLTRKPGNTMWWLRHAVKGSPWAWTGHEIYYIFHILPACKHTGCLVIAVKPEWVKEKKKHWHLQCQGRGISTFDRGFLSNIEGGRPKIALMTLKQSGGSAEAWSDILLFGEAWAPWFVSRMLHCAPPLAFQKHIHFFT